MSFPNSTGIRRLPYRTLRELASLLDIPGLHDWRALVAALPENFYTLAEINEFERANYKPNGSAAYELLKDLGTQLKTVGELITYLEGIDNQEALLLLKPHEPVFITEHPRSVQLQCGQDLVLKCEATGFPRPRYQWFKDRIELPDQLANEISLKKVSQEDSGTYYCVVTNPVGSEYTNYAEVQVVPMIAPIVRGVTGPDNMIPPSSRTSASQVDTVIMYPGQDFTMSCPISAQAYQWYKNGYPIPNACQKSLRFSPFVFGDDGFYSCKVRGNGQESICNAAYLKTAPNIVPPDTRFASKECATGKVALIIANKDYDFPQNEQLMHPVNDAKLLSEKLKEIGFNVFCFVNLNKREMEVAINAYCNVLKSTPGMYSVFYFCGHGIEEHGMTFLLPTDVPEEWNADSAISDTYVRYKIQECSTTKFDLFLLDVCRIRASIDSCSSQPPSVAPPPFKSGAQCVIGYSTCPQAQAYEKRRDSNGIYMKHLSRHITENMRIEHILEHVNKAVREEAELHHLTNAMHPTHTSYATKSFSLCDPILPFTGYVTGEVDPTILCFDYHRLPSIQVLEFPHGIICEISCEPYCSNVFALRAFVANYGEAKYCDAQIVEVDNKNTSAAAFQCALDRLLAYGLNNAFSKYYSYEGITNMPQVTVPPSLDFGSEYMNKERSALSELMERSLLCSDSGSTQNSSITSGKIYRVTSVSGLQKVGGSITVTIKLEYSMGNGMEEPIYKTHTFKRKEFGITRFFDSGEIECYR